MDQAEDAHLVEIKFPLYRGYRDNRVIVNDAMNALLVGSKLAAHTLRLTEGSELTLGQLFPQVEHVDRFNMKSDVARDFLKNADHHVATVALPYALATHEDFVMEVIELLRKEGQAIQTNVNNIKAWNMHNVLFSACGQSEPVVWTESFHVLREVRNCIIHSGGRVNDRLRKAIDNMGSEARSEWDRITGGMEPEEIEDKNAMLHLTPECIFMAFAVTKRLGREINVLLAKTLPVATWARIAVADYNSSTSRSRNSDGWRNGVMGHCKMYYKALDLTEQQIESAARDLDLWSLPRWE
ncbi:hypothetical protein [Micrococcus luteus]|uniref:hypothetical protein n=1 Tax=Micrococcus luteus TaxID=1270 RepID=UPI003EC0665F